MEDTCTPPGFVEVSLGIAVALLTTLVWKGSHALGNPELFTSR